MKTVRKALMAVLAILVLTAVFVVAQDVPEVRRFTDRAIQTLSLVALGLFVAGVIFVVAHRLGASTERSHLSTNTNAYASNVPMTSTPSAPQIFMLPPAQSNLPREVWERPLSSNQGVNSLADTGTPRKIDWSVIS
jgi:hypothetical protein